MAPERRNQIVLAVLLVVLAGALYRAFAPVPTDPAVVGAGADVAVAVAGRPAVAATRIAETPDVHLEALGQDRVMPVSAQRNLFRFRPRVVAAAAPAPGRVPPPPPVRPTAPVPTVPPILLKFIGVVEATEKSQTYAVLRDERGVYHGREGDIIEGRYRIVRIGAESIELSYVDGQGRQTIRLGS